MLSLCAASRDHTIKLWCNDAQSGTVSYNMVETRLHHKVKVITELRLFFEPLRLSPSSPALRVAFQVMH